MMVWEGGRYLSDRISRAPHLFEHRSVVELGAGCIPLPSLSALSVGADACIVTDGNEAVLKLAESNVHANAHLAIGFDKCTFQKLAWGDPVDLHRLLNGVDRIDWILGADVVYNEQGTHAFFQTVSRLLARFPDAKLLLSYIVRGIPFDRIHSLATSHGLQEIPLPTDFVHPDAGPLHLSMFVKKEIHGHVCMKCKAAKARAVVRQGTALCMDCLIEGVKSKFRVQFKTKNAIRPGDRVMIEGTGSMESQATIDLLLSYRHLDPSTVRRGKTYFHLTVLCSKSPARPSLKSSIQALLDGQGERSKGVVVADIDFGDEKWSESFPELDKTTRCDLEKIRRRKTILTAMQSLGCNALVSPSSSTSLTAEIVSLSCKGGGKGVADGLELFDRRFSERGVTIVRPMKEITASEIAFYCRFRKLPIVSASLLSVESVDDASKVFVHTLKGIFPSGASSILRTISKLQPSNVRRFCAICAEPVEQEDDTYCYPCRTHIVGKLCDKQLEKLMRTLEV